MCCVLICCVDNPWDMGTSRPGEPFHPDPKHHTYSFREGALQMGSDLPSTGNLTGNHTFAEAEQLCSSWLSCMGFTYNSAEQNFSGALRIYFKNATVINVDGTWSSYIRDGGVSDAVSLAQLMLDTGADGFNGDTMSWVPEQFYTKAKAMGAVGIAIEPEGGGDAMSQVCAGVCAYIYI